ncbi:Bifunctional deaminase-reductase domain protein [uncultured Pleomorphomonas sp.]|uniref:Bifunctional deaminase-reductase domain protein n=1 Tax=uncultured Pleomorphomonas sp. TaxID=442121 RepID=A0A212LDK1_9HYPH|nr:dihydrofolate reductase family protein [uncultured Pleomorphomonas sp.]SCM75621.1 Bifunctional deaminase-reductase domain protein [uncultured Pleomorphomonas sp.]
MICGYIASTLDGYIAAADHSFSFLDPYPAEEAGYEEFYAGIGTLVMGRITYEVCRRSLSPWPYAGKRLLVVTSGTLANLPADAEIWSAGIDALIDHLRADARQDVWIVGGGRLQQAFIDRDALDRLDQFIVPVVLGGGIPLYPDVARPRTLKLAEVGRFGQIAHLRLERP